MRIYYASWAFIWYCFSLKYFYICMMLTVEAWIFCTSNFHKSRITLSSLSHIRHFKKKLMIMKVSARLDLLLNILNLSIFVKKFNHRSFNFIFSLFAQISYYNTFSFWLDVLYGNFWLILTRIFSVVKNIWKQFEHHNQ